MSSARNPAESIQEALERYDGTQFRDYLATAERERTEMLKRFPLDGWPHMTLEDYALGQNSADVYSRWLEFGTPHLGSIKGGSAIKHLIYKKKDGLGWRFSNIFADEQAAWDSLHGAFVRMFDL